MPNHVENRLTFECSPEELQKILEDIQYDPDRSNEEYTGIGTFDFNNRMRKTTFVFVLFHGQFFLLGDYLLRCKIFTKIIGEGNGFYR